MQINNINDFHIFNNKYKPIQNTQTRFVTFAGKDTFNRREKKFINPVTKQHDRKIERMANSLSAKGASKSTQLAKAGIDASTGEYSPYFKKLMSYCYPSEMDKLFSKLKTGIGSKIYHRSDNSYKVPDLLNAMKDKNGDIAQENYEFVEKTLISQYKKNNLNIEQIANLINKIKDENGIIDEKEKNFVDELYNTRGVNYKYVKEVINFIRLYPEDKQQKIFDTIMAQREYNKMIEYFSDFIIRANFCFDKDGNRIEENIKIINEIDSKRYIIYSKKDNEFLNLCKESEDFRDVFYVGVALLSNKVNDVSQTIKKQLNANGKIEPRKKEMMLKILPYDQNLSQIENIFNACLNKKSLEESEETFQKILSLFELNAKVHNRLTKEKLIPLAIGELPANCESIQEKILIYEGIKNAYNISTGLPNAEKYSYIKDIIDFIEKEINMTNLSLPITQDNKTLALNSIFKSEKNELTEFEKVIKKSIPILNKHKNGLPLKYNKEKYINDIKNVVQKDEKAGLAFITNVLGFTDFTPPECFYSNNLKEQGNNNEIEKEILSLTNKFLYENEIQTGNKELDKQLNILIKAFPEFVNIIGRKQHETHAYSLDIHTLLVLARVINDNKYKQLNEKDKLTIKSVALFHDISKKENEIDKNHPTTSATAAKNILSKIYSNKDQLERVFNLIKYHNFLEEYDKSTNKEKTSKKLGFIFRRPNDFELAKILTKADLKSVNDGFYNEHKDKLEEKNLTNITEKINDFQGTGNAIFPTYIIKPTKTNTHKQTIKGKEYTLINTHNISNEKDMGEYGFEQGIRKKDLRFLVHMTNKLSTIKILDQSSEDSILSESFISLNNQGTYCDRKYGLIVKHKNYNIINTDSSNQGSGGQKDLDDIRRLIYKEERLYFKLNFLRLLGLNQFKVKKEDYQKFYNEVLANISSLRQINQNKTYKIGFDEFDSKKITSALIQCQDELLNKTKNEHNEIVGIAPEIQGLIAKEKNPDNLPDDFLDFAYENNYPIILI